MNHIWEFYENMNEIAYVSDIDSYEIIYMNRILREIYGVQSVEDLKGKKCHEVFQNSSKPCAICTNKILRPGHFVEWEYFNPLQERTYAVKDTLLEEDGRRYRMELAVDITVQAEQEVALREYRTNEETIIECLRVAMEEPRADKAIKRLIEYLGRALKCERVYIFEEQKDLSFSNTYEWCASGVIPQKDTLQNIPKEDINVWMERFRKNKNVIIRRLEDAKEQDPVIYDYLQPQDIQSLIVSPLIHDKRITGFYGVDNPPEEIMGNISNMFTIMGHFIIAMIRRRDLIQRLENLSYYDQLTGCGNRHGMEAFMASVCPEKSIGVIYLDVTGLKRVNDKLGHQAGDALLVRAAECLKKIFPAKALFRIGGDEFLVLWTGVQEEDIVEAIRRLKIHMKEQDVLMAIGYVWCPDSLGNIDALLSEADQRMYDDKQRYYADKDKDRRKRI
jgi:diguanylate cyclase (GGDEF)-like protein